MSMYGRFNRVDHCYFAGKTNEGALLVVWLDNGTATAPPTHRIDRNHFGPREELGRNGAETIRVGTSTYSMQDSDVVVENNLFTETNGETGSDLEQVRQQHLPGQTPSAASTAR